MISYICEGILENRLFQTSIRVETVVRIRCRRPDVRERQRVRKPDLSIGLRGPVEKKGQGFVHK